MLRKSEGTAMFQIERFKQDQKRLVEMLQQTKEYADFAKFGHLELALERIRVSIIF